MRTLGPSGAIPNGKREDHRWRLKTTRSESRRTGVTSDGPTRWMIGVVVDAEVQRTAELSDPGLCLKLSVRRSRFRDHNFASLVRFPTVGVGVL